MARFIANGYQSEIHPGWEDRSTITLVGPLAADGFAANLVVTRQPVPAGSHASEFGRAQVLALSAELDSLQIEDQRTTTLNGRELFQSMHHFRVGEQAVKQVQTYVVVNNDDDTIGLVITGTASPAAFDDAMPMFKKFIESFETFDTASHA